jgi:hypothetical protein
MEKVRKNARRPAVTGGKPTFDRTSSPATERGDLGVITRRPGMSCQAQ